MRKHLNDYLFSPLSLLMVATLFVLLLSVVLFLTPFGVKMLATVADSSLKELTIRGVSGSLLSGLHIDQIKWDDGDSISLSDVDLKIQYYDTDRGRLVAEKVTAGRLNINLENTGSSGGDVTSLPNFGLPLNLNAHLVQLDSLQITQDIPDDPGSRDLLFQIKNIQLKKVTITDGKLFFRRLSGNPIILGEPLLINVTEGRLNMDQPHDLRTSGSVSFKHPKLGDFKGDVQLAGTLTNYKFDGSIEHRHDASGKQTIDLVGQGDYKHVYFEKIILHGDKGRVNAKGRLLWNPEIVWNFLLEGEQLKTKDFLPEWPATLNTTLRYSGSYIDKRLENKVKIISLEGKLRKLDLKAAGGISLREGILTTDDLDVQLGNNNVRLTGRANEPFNLKWKVNAKNISQVIPKSMANLGIAGSIKGSGSLKGRLNKPEVNLDLSANHLAYKEFKQGRETLFLKGKLALNQAGALQVKNLMLKTGNNKLVASGQASEPFNLNWKIAANNLHQLSPLLAGSINGSGHLGGTINKPNLKLGVTASKLAYKDIKQGDKPLSVEGEVSLDRQLINLKNLRLKSGSNLVIVSGQASEPFNLSWKVDARNLKQLSPLLAGRVNGSGHLKGTLKKPEINIKLTSNGVAFRDIRQGKETLSLQGDLGLVNDVIYLKKLTAISGKNRVTASGQASEPMNLQLKIDAGNLKQVSPDLSGRIQGDAQLQGSYKSPLIKANLKAFGLRYQTYQLAQKKLALKGEVQLLNGVPMVKNLSVRAGNNHVQISGRASSPYNLSWDIDSKNLQQLIPGLAGRLLSKGTLQGSIDRPVINTTIKGKNLRYKGIRLGSIKASAQTKNGIYKIKGDLINLQTAAQKVRRLKVEANGRIDNHSIKLYAEHEEGKLSLKANGAWLKQKWKGTLQSLSLKDTKAGDWRLNKPTAVSLSRHGFSASSFCLGSKNTQACSSTLAWSDKSGLRTKGRLRKTPLALFKPWLPEGVILSGSVSGRYDIKQNAGKPVGSIQLTFPNSNFSFKNADGEEQILAYKNAELNATINNRTIIAKAKMEILNRGQLAANATIKLSPGNGRHTIDGNAEFDVPNINWAQRYIPHSRGLRGKLKSKIKFTGLLSNPQIRGEADLKNAYLRLPEAGTELTNINISARADRPGQAIIKGKALMGRGAINITGSLNARDVTRWKVTLKISGNNIRFMNTNEVKATMSPDLTLGITPKVVSIQGKVLIPEANINLKAIPETSIDESEDVYVIGERKPGEQLSAVKIQPNVLIQLGDKIKINAFGLRAKLSGRVNISHNRKDILANGSLRVSDGKYQAYGQNLEINNGRLIFNGSPKIIGMDIRATRKVDKYLVGVHLGGNLLNPKSKIFSEPALPESEALSFLLTGHSLSTSTGRESALLMSAVRGLGITGNDSLLHSIGSSLGLDDVNIVTNTNYRKSELSLGKRLGPRLYVRYLVGLFDSAQKIAIEYRINKRLSFEAKTSADKYGFDFIYEFERD